MRLIIKELSLEKEDYVKTHLEVINPFLPVKLSGKEIEVLALFISIADDFTLKVGIFNALARKVVRKRLQLSPSGLSNYIGSMKKSGYIYLDEYNIFRVRDYLLPSKDKQNYNFTLKVQYKTVEI